MIKDILDRAMLLRKITKEEIEWWYNQADKKALDRQKSYRTGNLHMLEEWLKYNEKDILWLKSKLYEKNITYNDALNYEKSTKFMENGMTIQQVIGIYLIRLMTFLVLGGKILRLVILL